MRILLIMVLSLLGCSGSIDEPVSYFNVETPRPFGYVNGDEIPQRIIIETRSGITLQTGSLPAKGQINRWLNLNQVTVKQSGQRYEIDLLYQVFYAPLEVKTLTLPGFTVQLSQGEKSIGQNVPAWTFTLSPLRELIARQSEQGEYMRPDSPPPLLTDTQALYGLAASLSVAALIAAYLAYLYGCFPNMSRRTVFKRALRKLAGLSKTDMAQALTLVHQALNSLNGQPLFANRLSEFYRRNPQYRQISAQLLWFFNYSNRYFFSGGMIVVAQDLQQLKDLCEHCRKIERGSR
ncbi:MAG: nonribosomal peptide synthetase MxaA [Methylobacter sp.]|nr:nonribosomal peptide synthetase MxaA [Methylobacter sp.]MDP2099082.1 nonribosomal peptide synthetase MxaA [Methylobacter sp.]MDP2426627.1 nonribosomal peptide synthetase MxaA [Methylobacter sp.]MDP3056598.1 nonribosomal peptide synthetase MxaA [Methylobacter sp.]MDP3362600.1 nonribosomal peptide synthetase MxaA [Methylobacter sp.]